MLAIDKEGDKKLTVSEVRVVRENLDVFPDDLPDMPLKQEMEFTIDLILEAVPISKATYRIAPKKLQE